MVWNRISITQHRAWTQTNTNDRNQQGNPGVWIQMGSLHQWATRAHSDPILRVSGTTANTLSFTTETSRLQSGNAEGFFSTTAGIGRHWKFQQHVLQHGQLTLLFANPTEVDASLQAHQNKKNQRMQRKFEGIQRMQRKFEGIQRMQRKLEERIQQKFPANFLQPFFSVFRQHLGCTRHLTVWSTKYRTKVIWRPCFRTFLQPGLTNSKP